MFRVMTLKCSKAPERLQSQEHHTQEQLFSISLASERPSPAAGAALIILALSFVSAVA